MHDTAPPLLALHDVTRRYTLPRESLFARAPSVDALHGVSLSLRAGRSLGVVGESGSGKSTLARIAMALEAPSSGRVEFMGRDLNALPAAELRAARRDFQMVFQDPYGSLDPRQRVGRIVAEPLALDGLAQRETAVAEALDAVGLRASDAHKYPHEFSGGQRQRIAIARALLLDPRLLILDDSTSAVDAETEASIRAALDRLMRSAHRTAFVIAQRISTVRDADLILVLDEGRIAAQGRHEELLSQGGHYAELYATYFRHQALKAHPIRGGGAGLAQIAIDDDDLPFAPSQRPGLLFQGILPVRAFGVLHDLAQCRLPHIEVGSPFQMLRSYLAIERGHDSVLLFGVNDMGKSHFG